uniref:Uncharacterized protein n=1 Tax=Lotharella oceanica TaxID=641309 RepID=A0A7S2TNG7_9EUKA|mmetsp:Transcript_20603/g.38756  ORF Transcript_20603/g.38756 Transcript_20603/m.38756 type:complete len:343 (+) Transcript_20603:73-1101(+)
MAFFMKPLRAYGRALNRAPIRTKMATSFTVLTSADLIRQVLEYRWALQPQPVPEMQRGSEKNADSKTTDHIFPWWDPERTMRMSFWGLTFHPWAIHFWFNHMERWIGTSPPGASRAAVVSLVGRKVVVDQLMSSPVFLGFFLVYTQLTKGKSYEDIKRTLHEDWFTLAKAGWSCWPIAHCFGFAFIPVHWRLLYVNFITLGFGTFLSLMASQGGKGVITPVDKVYQGITGAPKDATFGSKEGLGAAVSSAWILGSMGMAYHWRKVGMLGLGCGIAGGSMCLIETSILYGFDHIWAGPLGLSHSSEDLGTNADTRPSRLIGQGTARAQPKQQMSGECPEDPKR